MHSLTVPSDGSGDQAGLRPLPNDFAVLTYRTRNLGDHIQSIAARRLLPCVNAMADRDWLNRFVPAAPTRLICNGWFGRNPQGFGFADTVQPLLISMHMSPRTNPGPDGDLTSFAEVLRGVPPLRAELTRFGPVGARDRPTQRLLEEIGVESWFSGCLTLTLERDPGIERRDEIVVCDVPPDVVAYLRAQTKRPVRVVTHVTEAGLDASPAFQKAEALLRVYQAAHLVVTTRLHCALPCVAFGTPTIFLMPDFEVERFDGLSDLVRSLPLSSAGTLTAACLEHPRPPDRSHAPMRDALRQRVADFVNAPLAASTHASDLLFPGEAVTAFHVRTARAWHDQALEYRASFEALAASNSWRLTAPLRRLKRALSRGSQLRYRSRAEPGHEG